MRSRCFWDAATSRLDFWYIDLIGPAQRRPFGFDFIEDGLDIVVEPDVSRWTWKDHDELEWAVGEGHYSRVEADGLYREGERAVERLAQDRATFEPWGEHGEHRLRGRCQSCPTAGTRHRWPLGDAAASSGRRKTLTLDHRNPRR